MFALALAVAHALTAAIAAVFLAANSPSVITSIYHRAASVNLTLFERDADQTIYVSSGDISGMWLRDSSVQAMTMLRNRKLVRGVIGRQERLIVLDPYANAFQREYRVIERKFEIDSLCYPVKLIDRYVRATGDRSIFDGRLFAALRKILATLAIERQHAKLSRYHHNEHPAADDIGLIWSAFRPSDDAQAYNYNIPENMFAAVSLRQLADIFRAYYSDGKDARVAVELADGIESGIERAIFKTVFGHIYAYEIDGLGHAKFMDDANVPSLLSIPLLGYHYDGAVYEATRRFIFNPANPYYFEGRYASGIGSSHTPAGYIWPMSLVVEYRTATRGWEQQHVLQMLADSHAGDGVLHESFDVNDPRHFTRERFGWVNALFQETFSPR